MEGRNLDITMRATGKSYTFIIDGYEIVFRLSPRDTVGEHPLDILEIDLGHIYTFLKKLERFKKGVGMSEIPGNPPMQLMTPGDGPGTQTVEAFIEKHKPPKDDKDKKDS